MLADLNKVNEDIFGDLLNQVKAQAVQLSVMPHALSSGEGGIAQHLARQLQLPLLSGFPQAAAGQWACASRN